MELNSEKGSNLMDSMSVSLESGRYKIRPATVAVR